MPKAVFRWLDRWERLDFLSRGFSYAGMDGRLFVDRRSAGNWCYWFRWDGKEHFGHTGMGTGPQREAQRVATMRLREFLQHATRVAGKE